MGTVEQRDDPADEAATSDRWEDELIPGHEYDGIREYDNPVPGWLSLLFTGTIIWSLFYVVAINLGYIARYEETLEEGQRELANMRQAAESDREKVTPDRLAAAVEEEERKKSGKAAYNDNCASCHREDGGGEIGPNLTDPYWIHGGSLMDIYKTVTQGVSDKGMPAWKDQLSQQERIDVTAYVRSLQGTEPADAKEPEGDKFEPEQ